MGIKQLNKLIKEEAPAGRSLISLDILAGKTAAIDLSGYLFQFCYNANNRSRGPYLRGFFEMIVTLAKYHIKPVFVFDGKASSAKNDTLKQRQQSTDKKHSKIASLKSNIIKQVNKHVSVDQQLNESVGADEELDMEDLMTTCELPTDVVKQIGLDLAEIAQIEKGIIKIRGHMFEELKQMLKLTNCKYIKAQGEADFMCVKLCKLGLADFVISEDMDMLTHGAPFLVRGINSMEFRRNKMVSFYCLERVLNGLGLDFAQFVDMSILCGCDYTKSPDGIGIKTALKLIKRHKNIETAATHSHYDYSGCDYQCCREEFKKSDLQVLPEDFTVTFPTISSNDRKELSTMLTTLSNYTTKTLNKKIEEIDAARETANQNKSRMPRPRLELKAKPRTPPTRIKLSIKAKH